MISQLGEITPCDGQLSAWLHWLIKVTASPPPPAPRQCTSPGFPMSLAWHPVPPTASTQTPRPERLTLGHAFSITYFSEATITHYRKPVA